MKDQNAVIAFLGNPASYSPVPPTIERVDTHGAHVFLAGAQAIKIKRAVRYPYLDFSTLKRRRVAIAREFEINQPTAPEIYERVVPITLAAPDQLRLGGIGEIVEWALIMRRFEQSALLSRIVASQGLKPADVKALADTVYQSHQRATIAHGVDQPSRLATLIGEISEGLGTAGCDSGGVGSFCELAKHRLKQTAGLLAHRARQGFVRRCHGDLHLANLVMWNGRPTLFDALEFDEELATIDTLYDLAFLIMDLEASGARATANQLLNDYLRRSGVELDFSGLAGLPLFLALRSAIRAMVTLQRSALATAARTEPAQTSTGDCLHAAMRYLKPPPAVLVAIGGFSGTGKSTLAAALAPLIAAAPGAVHLRSDLERKSLFRAGETERLGAVAYSQESSSKVYAKLLEKAGLVVGAGHAVVVDAVFSKLEERTAIEVLARHNSVPFHGLWLDAGADQMAHRVAGRVGDASDATPEVVRAQLERGAGEITWTHIDARGSREATLATSCRVLGVSWTAARVISVNAVPC